MTAGLVAGIASEDQASNSVEYASPLRKIKPAGGAEQDLRNENPDNAGQFRFARLNHGNPAWKSRSIFSTISVSKPNSMTSR
jgi:hypothetical protein